ncbi:MAG TPA: rRNA pseudouridine synthase, partial [Bacteroidetes bacterium]|nr:rRNA pseudouridine synthase [Bacteroidota bacterium]
ASRRACEVIIAEGRVRVEGVTVTDPATPVHPERSRIEVDGSPLPEAREPVYLALNKPPGVLSSFVRGREKGRLLGEFVKHEARLVPVGRLDRDSRGLLLLTDDGDWANRVAHPRHGTEKEYRVLVAGAKPAAAARRLAAAEFEENGRRFRAASVRAEGRWLRVVLHEGRKRQIRRLAREAGLTVRELVRVRIGPVRLGRLKEGHWRKLTPGEVGMLGKPGGKHR